MNLLNFFKKKKIKTFEETYYKNKDIKKTKKTISLEEEIKKDRGFSFLEKLFSSKKKEVKFPSFEKFVETLFDVISNYKDKPGFSKQDALRMVGKKINSSTIEMLSNVDNKLLLLSLLKLSKDEKYYQFQEIFTEPSLDKTLEILELVKRYLKEEKKYNKTKKYVGPLLNLYAFGFLFGFAQRLSIPYLILSQQMTSPDVFYKTWESYYQKMLVSPFVAVSVPDIYLKIQFILEIIIILGVPLVLMFLGTKTIIQYLEDKNVRLLDKYWNEYRYNLLIRIKVIQMKLSEDRYEKTNYIFFLKSVGQLCYDRGLVNFDWYKDFLKILQIFEAIYSIVPYKEVKNNISELFFVTFTNILEAYRGYILGVVKNFNLGYIYEKFDSIVPIQEYFIEKSIDTFIGVFSMVIVVMLVGFNIWGGVAQLQDMQNLTNIIGGDIGG